MTQGGGQTRPTQSTVSGVKATGGLMPASQTRRRASDFALQRPFGRRRPLARSQRSSASSGASGRGGDGRSSPERSSGRRPEHGLQVGAGCGARGGHPRGSAAPSWHQEHGDVLGCGWLGPWARWRHGWWRGATASVETVAAVIEKQGEEGQTTMELTAVAEGVEAGSGKARRRRTGASDLDCPR